MFNIFSYVVMKQWTHPFQVLPYASAITIKIHTFVKGPKHDACILFSIKAYIDIVLKANDISSIKRRNRTWLKLINNWKFDTNITHFGLNASFYQRLAVKILILAIAWFVYWINGYGE